MINICFIYLLPVFATLVATILNQFQRIKFAIFGSLQLRIFNYAVLGFSFFGLTIGAFVGLSSSPVVGAVLPAILTFIGAMIAYYFFTDKQDQSNDNQILTMLAMICLSLSLPIGAYSGALQRKYSDQSEKIDEMNKTVTLKKIENILKMDVIQFEYNLKNTDSVKFEDIPEVPK